MIPAITGSSLDTAVAHVFNERGEDVIVRGGAAHISKKGFRVTVHRPPGCWLHERAEWSPGNAKQKIMAHGLELTAR